jgi:hypothetical protein
MLIRDFCDKSEACPDTSSGRYKIDNELEIVVAFHKPTQRKLCPITLGFKLFYRKVGSLEEELSAAIAGFTQIPLMR